MMWYAADQDGNVTCFGSVCGPDHPKFSERSFGRGEAYERDGVLVPYTPEQMAARAHRPPGATRWSNATMSWIDERTAQERAEADAFMARMEIQRVESSGQRAMREAVLAIAAAVGADPGRLAEVERQIRELRERVSPRP